MYRYGYKGMNQSKSNRIRRRKCEEQKEVKVSK